MKMRNVMLILGLFTWPTAQSAVYKWVDEDNQIHYTQKPVSGAKRMHVPSTPPSTEPINEVETLKDKVIANEKANNQENLIQENESNLAKIKAYNCKVAKEKYASLEQPRVKEKTSTGYRLMDEEERQAQLAKAKLEINQYCLK